MSENFNDKKSSIQMRELIKKVRNGNNDNTTTLNTKKNITIRDFLKITRKLNENEKIKLNRKTVYDQKREEVNFINALKDLNVIVDFNDLKIYDDEVIWGGIIDGIIEFKYKVTKNENTSGVEFDYLTGFSPDNPDNEIIVDRVEKHFDSFYKYWRDNLIQK